jgi:hypothetical protein
MSPMTGMTPGTPLTHARALACALYGVMTPIACAGMPAAISRPTCAMTAAASPGFDLPVVSLIEAKSSVTPERRGQNPHLTLQEPILS